MARRGRPQWEIDADRDEQEQEWHEAETRAAHRWDAQRRAEKDEKRRLKKLRRAVHTQEPYLTLAALLDGAEADGIEIFDIAQFMAWTPPEARRHLQDLEEVGLAVHVRYPGSDRMSRWFDPDWSGSYIAYDPWWRRLADAIRDRRRR